MTKHYYAATLRGDGEPMAIDKVYVFDYYSQRKQWLIENDNSIAIIAKLAKKHKQVQVTFENTAKVCGAKIWAWVYDGKADWITQRFE